MNDNTKKTIAGVFMVVPGVYLAEELILGHLAEPHVAESLHDTSPIIFTMSTVSGTTTTTGPINFVNDTNFYTYNQTT